MISLPRLHVGITVWPARSDFFYYLRNWADVHSPKEAYRKLTLPPDLLALVSRLEYSPFWMFRVVLYSKVARFLERELRAIMDEADGKYSEVIFYTPDDGYWAELLHAIRRRINGRLRIFNVQHGQPSLIRRPQKLRRAVNRLSVAITGYPNFGYGFGAGTLDGYIVMSEHERAFIAENFTAKAYVAPQFIRGDFLDAARNMVRSRDVGGRFHILFAMNPIFATRSDLFGSRTRAEMRFFSDIADCLRLIRDVIPSEIVFRFHPGQNREAAEALFQSVGLGAVAEIDNNFNIVESLTNCDFVIAYASTVLLEANLLGKVPVNFVPAAYPPPWSLTVRTEILTLSRDATGTVSMQTGRGHVSELFNRDVITEYAASVTANLDYSESLPWLD